MLAHSKVDEKRGLLCCCAVEFDIASDATAIKFAELDEDLNVVAERHVTTDFCVFHDWSLLAGDATTTTWYRRTPRPS